MLIHVAPGCTENFDPIVLPKKQPSDSVRDCLFGSTGRSSAVRSTKKTRSCIGADRWQLPQVAAPSGAAAAATADLYHDRLTSPLSSIWWRRRGAPMAFD
jgi:hypothetical protein